MLVSQYTAGYVTVPERVFWCMVRTMTLAYTYIVQHNVMQIMYISPTGRKDICAVDIDTYRDIKYK